MDTLLLATKIGDIVNSLPKEISPKILDELGGRSIPALIDSYMKSNKREDLFERITEALADLIAISRTGTVKICSGKIKADRKVNNSLSELGDLSYKLMKELENIQIDHKCIV